MALEVEVTGVLVSVSDALTLKVMHKTVERENQNQAANEAKQQKLVTQLQEIYQSLAGPELDNLDGGKGNANIESVNKHTIGAANAG